MVGDESSCQVAPSRLDVSCHTRDRAVHSRYVARHIYSLTEEPRFEWILVFIALIWATSYAAGLPDAGDALVVASRGPSLR